MLRIGGPCYADFFGGYRYGNAVLSRVIVVIITLYLIVNGVLICVSRLRDIFAVRAVRAELILHRAACRCARLYKRLRGTVIGTVIRSNIGGNGVRLVDCKADAGKGFLSGSCLQRVKRLVLTGVLRFRHYDPIGAAEGRIVIDNIIR